MDISVIINTFELSFLREAAGLADSRLELLDRVSRTSDDPDGDGVFDRAEYITGFGLVACQTYITASVALSRLDKKQALALGPPHHSGYKLVFLVDALANYWKHSSEWEQPLQGRAQMIASAIAKLSVDINAPYVMSNALASMLRPSKPRIERLVPFLSQWHDSL